MKGAPAKLLTARVEAELQSGPGRKQSRSGRKTCRPFSA